MPTRWQQAKEVELRARGVSEAIWLRITAMWDDEDPNVQQLSAVYLARELAQHVVHLHHLTTRDPDAQDRLEGTEETKPEEEQTSQEEAGDQADRS